MDEEIISRLADDPESLLYLLRKHRPPCRDCCAPICRPYRLARLAAERAAVQDIKKST